MSTKSEWIAVDSALLVVVPWRRQRTRKRGVMECAGDPVDGREHLRLHRVGVGSNIIVQQSDKDKGAYRFYLQTRRMQKAVE